MNKERTEPRISVNQLGKYLVASAHDRTKILRKQKYPDTNAFIPARYSGALPTIQEFLISHGKNQELISTAIAELQKKPTQTVHQNADKYLCIEALASILGLAKEFAGRKEQIDKPTLKETALMIANVKVSVYPDLITKIIMKDGSVQFGVVKIHFSKGTPLNEVTGQYVSTLLYHFGSELLSHIGKCNQKLCYVVDVFSNQLFTAPQSFTRRMNDITDACQEIYCRWDSI